MFEDLLELVVPHFGEELALRQDHIPTVVLDQVQGLVYRLQHVGQRVCPSPSACHVSCVCFDTINESNCQDGQTGKETRKAEHRDDRRGQTGSGWVLVTSIHQ